MLKVNQNLLHMVKLEKGKTSFYQFLGFSIDERQLKFRISFHLMEKEDLSNLHQIIKDFLF